MRCTSKRLFRKNRNRSKHRILYFLSILLVVSVLGILIYFVQDQIGVASLKRREKKELEAATRYTENLNNEYKDSVYQADLFAEDLCVITENVISDNFTPTGRFFGALLLDQETGDPIYAEQIYNRVYPASTTKILTAYVALKHGDLGSIITVSKNAVSVPSDSSKANLREGDQVTLKDALYALMLPSGNDCAVAIAEHISGSVEAFASLMNQEAKLLGATKTHFINPHGYHSTAHYTTTYDLYLIFNAAIQNPVFVDVVSTAEWTTDVIQKDGTTRSMTWKQSNQFVNGTYDEPNGIDVIGGKTGTTGEAGACLVLYSTKEDKTPYISIIMGAYSKPNLYHNMSMLLQATPN